MLVTRVALVRLTDAFRCESVVLLLACPSGNVLAAQGGVV